MGAGASVVVNPDAGQNAVSTEQTAWTDAVAAGETITISATNAIGIMAGNGFAIENNMYLGSASDQGSINGDLHILNTVSDPFTITSGGDVSIGAMLQVLDGKTLSFKAPDSGTGEFNLTIGSGGTNEGVRVGTALQNAKLNVSGVNDFVVNGSVISYGDVNVAAKSVDVGLINVGSGDMMVGATGAVKVAGLVANTDGSVDVDAGTTIVANGTVQNNAGDMTLDAGGNITVTGALENAGGNMIVNGASISVSETMKNDSVDGSLTINASSLAINGGSQNSYSFVNAGNFDATVTGDTYFKYGLNLSGMANDNHFVLDTGTLTFGDEANFDKWASAFSNHLDAFYLVVREGDINTTAYPTTGISNGVNQANGANMVIAAQNIYTGAVRNDGTLLRIVAGGEMSGLLPNLMPVSETAIGNIVISGAVDGAAGAKTDIVAADTVTVSGGVSNAGNMLINANTVNLADVSNSGNGAEIIVSSLTDETGTVNISGNVTNALGTTNVSAKNVTIGGAIVNNSGITNVRGSDANGGAVKIGAINVAGGTVNLDALAGAMDVDSTIGVTGGALNLGTSLYTLTVGGAVQVAGNLTAGATNAVNAGDVNVAASGSEPFVLSADSISIGGNVSAVDTSLARQLQFDAATITIAGNVTAENHGHIVFGTNAPTYDGYARVNGNLVVQNGGIFETWADDLYVGTLSGNGLFVAHGENITANAGDINVDGNVYFDVDNDPIAPESGLIVRDTSELDLVASADGADISVGAVSVGNGNRLGMKAADVITIGGAVANNGELSVDTGGNVNVTDLVTNTGNLDVDGAAVGLSNVQNSGTVTITSAAGDIDMGDVTTSGTMQVVSAADVTTGALEQTGGVLDVTGTNLNATYVNIAGDVGTTANLNVDNLSVNGNLRVGADVVHGGVGGMLNTMADYVSAANLNVGGDFRALSGVGTHYDIGTNINLGGNLEVANGADITFSANSMFDAADLVNSGNIAIDAGGGISLDKIVSNSGIIDLNSHNMNIGVGALEMNGGNLLLNGASFSLAGDFDTGAMLYQQYAGALADKDINVIANKYEISVQKLDVAGINQNGVLVINTSDVDVAGDIVANNLRFVANPAGNWMNVNVDGNVSGGVGFVGLEKMTIGGNYTFDSDSVLNAAILPYAATGAGINETDVNYWATVSLSDDNTLGEITNAADGRAMINVAGQLTSGAVYSDDIFSLDTIGTPLKNGQIGISLYDAVDQGTAIWLLHADGGVDNFSLAEQIRNLDVDFCNADGSLCFNYLEALATNNAATDDLPAYISVRDTDGDGQKDSLYVVFDPRFGGPVLLENMKIQPIVGREPDHTTGEYVSAGALDNLLMGQARDKLFLNRTPIEVIPLIFAGTNMEEMANELYNRMEYYVENPDGAGLARFSRLFQVRELEQIAGAVVLNEHTAFRTFEDRMFDEFIWNRNRQLKKAWMDVDYGMFYQNIDDGKHTDGNRFGIMGGFDWQESDTLILGLTGRVSHTSSSAHDAMDLGYRPGENIAGNVNIDVADTNIGFGGYLMHTLGDGARLYGNAFVDFHFLDVTRNQNFVDTIDGDGMAFSLISEWGLMHDILNQYIVGNLYARAGYNFGFNVKEKVMDEDYMRLKSDGYFVLTPGYSLTAQKRIYPSAWFQIRPYASIGVEYDVLGAPDSVKYKFVPAEEFTKYAVDIDPLWANIGGGVEMLSAHGLQMGIDYRYQYNQDIQLHNIKVSGSYRF